MKKIWKVMALGVVGTVLLVLYFHEFNGHPSTQTSSTVKESPSMETRLSSGLEVKKNVKEVLLKSKSKHPSGVLSNNQNSSEFTEAFLDLFRPPSQTGFLKKDITWSYSCNTLSRDIKMEMEDKIGFWNQETLSPQNPELFLKSQNPSMKALSLVQFLTLDGQFYQLSVQVEESQTTYNVSLLKSNSPEAQGEMSEVFLDTSKSTVLPLTQAFQVFSSTLVKYKNLGATIGSRKSRYGIRPAASQSPEELLSVEYTNQVLTEWEFTPNRGTPLTCLANDSLLCNCLSLNSGEPFD
jgi:hypothetical protein